MKIGLPVLLRENEIFKILATLLFIQLFMCYHETNILDVLLLADNLIVLQNTQSVLQKSVLLMIMMMKIRNENEGKAGPVSYTHLDVYKRQH